MRFFLNFCLLLLLSASAIAQESKEVEMADAMRSNGKIYVVLAVILILFIGLLIYLISIDRKLTKLEKELKKAQ